MKVRSGFVYQGYGAADQETDQSNTDTYWWIGKGLLILAVAFAYHVGKKDGKK